MVIGDAFDDRRKRDSSLVDKFLGDKPDWIGGTAQASEQFERDVQNFCQRTEARMKVTTNIILWGSRGCSSTRRALGVLVGLLICCCCLISESRLRRLRSGSRR